MRRPSDITRFVVAVVVNAIKGVSFWTLANIIQVSLEGRSPLRTDLNSSCTVIFVIGVIGVGTSVLHRKPRTVHKVEPPTGLTMSTDSALSAKPTTQRRTLDHSFLSALTLASPVVSGDSGALVILATIMPKYSPLAELLAGKITGAAKPNHCVHCTYLRITGDNNDYANEPGRAEKGLVTTLKW